MNMKIYIVLFVLFWSTQANHAVDSLDLNSVTVCATLNNVYRTFSNIWEIYSEFKASGQLWVPVAINACPVTYVDCPSFTPVCAVSSNNFYKTFPNKCVLEAEHKATGIAWNVLFYGICSANSGVNFENVNIAAPVSQVPQSQLSDQGSHVAGDYNPHTSSSLYDASSSSPTSYDVQKYGSVQQQILGNYPKAVQPISNGDFNQNSAQLSPTHIETQAVNNRTSLPDSAGEQYSSVQDQQPVRPLVDDSSSSYDSSVLPTSGQYNSVQQSDSVANYREPIRAFENEQIKQNSAQLTQSAVNSQLSFNFDPIVVQSQAEQASLPSYPSSSNDVSSLSAAQQYNSIQQAQPLPNYPEPIGNEQINQNTAHQIAVQAQATQASLSSDSSNSYDGSLLSADRQYSSVEQPRHVPTYQDSAQFSASSANFPLSSNTNQIAVPEQASLPNFSSSSYDRSLLSAEGLYNSIQQPQTLPNYPEPIQTLDNRQISHSSAELSASSVNVPLSGNSNHIVTQAQAEPASYPSTSYGGSSLSVGGQYNSNQQPQPVPNYPEQIQAFGNDQIKQHSTQLLANSVDLPLSGNSNQILVPSEQTKHVSLPSYSSSSYDGSLLTHSSNLNQITVQSQPEQASLSSYSATSYGGSSQSAADQYNSIEQTRPLSNNPVPIQTLDYGQINQNLGSEQLDHPGDYNSIQQPQSVPNYPEPIQPLNNGQIHQNSAQLSVNLLHLPLSGDSNENVIQSQSNQAALPSYSSLPNEEFSQSAAGQYNSVQQTQSVPNYPEPIQPLNNGQTYRNSAQLSASYANLPLSSESNQKVIQSQSNQAALPSYSSSSNDELSKPAVGQFNSVQQTQSVPSYPEPIQPLNNGQIYQNSAQLSASYANLQLSSESNQKVIQSQSNQAGLPSYSSSPNVELSQSTAGQYNSVQQPQSEPNYPEPLQPLNNGQIYQNSAQLSARYAKLPLSSDSNQNVIQSQSNQAALLSYSSSPNVELSQSAAGQYNSVQQPQSVPNYPEPIEPLNNGQIYQNSAQLSASYANLPLSSDSNQNVIQSQSNEAALPSYSSSPNVELSQSAAGQYNSVQQTQSVPNYPEPLQPLNNGQIYENSAQLSASYANLPLSSDSNQKVIQSQSNQAALPSYSSSSNDELSKPAVGEFNSVQQPQYVPNYPEPIQSLINGEIYQNSAQLSARYVNLPLSSESNQNVIQSQSNQAGLPSYSSSPNVELSQSAAGQYNSVQQPQSMPNYPEPIEPLNNGQIYQNSAQLSASYVNLPHSTDSNQNAIQSQSNEAALPSYSSSPNVELSQSAAGQYNSVQQPQSLPNYPELIEPLNNGQIYRNSAQLSASYANLPLSSDSNQNVIQSQSNEAALPSYSSSPNVELSQSAAGQYNSVQQPQSMPNYPEPIEPLNNGQIYQNPAQLSASYVNLPHSTDSNQNAIQSQSNEAALPSYSSSPNVELSQSAAGQYNSVQQPQSLPNYPELIEPLNNGQIYRNSAQLSASYANLPLSSDSNQNVIQSQSNEAALPSYSSSPNVELSQSAAGQYNSIQQPQSVPNYPELIEPLNNGQIYQNSAQLSESYANLPLSSDSNQNVIQSQSNEAALTSYSSSSYEGSALSAAGQYNSVQQLQPKLANYPEQIRPFVNGQIINSPLSDKSNQIDAQSEEVLASYSSSNDGSSLPLTGHFNAVQQIPTNYHEVDQPFGNGELNQNSPQLSLIPTHFDNSAVLPVPKSIPLQADTNAEENSYSQSNINSCGQNNEDTIDSAQSDESYLTSIASCASDTAPCSNSQTYTSPAHDSQKSPPNSPVSKVISSTNYNQNYSDEISQDDYDNNAESKTYKNDNENSNQYAQNQGQTIYNGVVYQGPYYYEPKYKHINFGSFNFLPAPGSVGAPFANTKSPFSTDNSNAAVPGLQYRINPFEQLLKQLKYVASRKEKPGY